MKYLKFMAGVMVVLLPILVYVFWPGQVDRIKSTINDGITAAEAGDIGEMMSAVSLNYHDDKGLSYLYIRKILDKQLKPLTDIKFEVVSMKVRILGEKAFVTLETRMIATFADGVRGYYLGDIDSPFVIELEMRNESPRGWKVISAKYGTSHANNHPMHDLSNL